MLHDMEKGNDNYVMDIINKDGLVEDGISFHTLEDMIGFIISNKENK